MNAGSLLIVLLHAAPAAPRSSQVSLAPAVVELSGKAGQSTTQRLRLTNGAPVPLAFAMEALDVVVAGGARRLVAAGDTPASIAATAVFSERSLVVPPGATRTVDVTLTIPPGVAHRAVVVMFRGTTRLGDARASSTASLGTLLTFKLSDGASLEADALQVTPQTGAANASFEQVVVNAGTEPVVPRGAAIVIDRSGAVAARVAFDARRVLPGERTTLRAEYGGELPPGRHRVLATFEYAGRTLTRTAEVVVP